MNINLTLALQMVAFAAFVWFCWRFIWPQIREAMQTRVENIAKGLEAAEQSEQRQQATAEELEGFMGHLRQVACQTGFLNPAHPRLLMRRLRRLFIRAQPDRTEINILRGFLKAIQRATEERGRD